ncbi:MULTISPECIES: hypothetical protein [unclassified Paraburkholderia]|uniref:hypothetical protein n=1 Tax=unclassified Paraburkholderia TaxID=2615204 RepID=UPI0016175195|nr:MULTISPECIES: hypothetical protein [unclassified Paraburkholderia]MBB5448218.1 hypothetical protein [Paraburkholderia sp. WSM4177]MBB5488607.1 hypothetical protein [Paraburkholderia sp. WSM4180]
MGLPRHLKGKFNAVDGAPIAADTTAGQAATSGTPTNDAANAEALNGNATQTEQAGDPSAIETGTAVETTHATSTDDGDGTATATTTTTTTTTAEANPDAGADANYRRMEGRYKADIQRLKDQLAEAKEAARGTVHLTDLLMETRQELAELKRTGAAASSTTASDAAANAAEAEPDLPALSDDEQATYGDFMPVAEKLIARATAPLLKKIATLESQAGTVTERIGQTEEGQFVRDVSRHVGDMKAITTAPDWQEFLKKPIRHTRMNVAEALRTAHKARDMETIVGIFDDFKKSRPTPAADAQTTQQAPQQTTTPASAQAQATQQPTGLAQFATPDRTAANPSGVKAPKFRASDYRAKVDAMRTGRISKEDFMQFETEFNEASRAGLVSQT